MSETTQRHELTVIVFELLQDERQWATRAAAYEHSAVQFAEWLSDSAVDGTPKLDPYMNATMDESFYGSLISYCLEMVDWQWIARHMLWNEETCQAWLMVESMSDFYERTIRDRGCESKEDRAEALSDLIRERLSSDLSKTASDFAHDAMARRLNSIDWIALQRELAYAVPMVDSK